MAAHKIKINIQLPEQDDAKLLVSHINKRLVELGKTAREINFAEVRFRYDKTGDPSSKICDIYLVMTVKKIFTSQKGRTFGEAANKAITKLQLQLNPPVTQ